MLIEHYAGAFPLWLAPVQVGLVPISERHLAYAERIQQQLQKQGFRVELDARNEKMNAKIRDFTMQKVPYVLVMGDKETEGESVSVRARGKGDQGSVAFDEFVARIQKMWWRASLRNPAGAYKLRAAPLVRRHISMASQLMENPIQNAIPKN